MKLVPALLFLISLTNCSQKENRNIRSVLVSKPLAIAAINYDSCKKAILISKQKHKAGWQHISKPEKEKIFTSAVAETIIPGWIGTPWDFNGTTENPQKGTIACGYFVTTVLRDAGLSLARVKLAQCASEQMIVWLVQSKYINRFSNVKMEVFIHSIKEQGYGLYIVGLDNHTGFIYNDGKEIYFIHSTFIGTRNVQKENAALSWILEKSKYKVLAKISSDEKVLEIWMN